MAREVDIEPLEINNPASFETGSLQLELLRESVLLAAV
jgi:hypothetical protein